MSTRRTRRPIVTRLVVRVAVVMTVILLAASGFVYWRVGFALNRQLDQDLAAWQRVVARDVRTGVAPPRDLPGLTYQVYDERGRVADGRRTGVPLADGDRRAEALREGGVRYDVGRFLPAPPGPVFRVQLDPVRLRDGHRVLVASAISRGKHDEALRELLLQLLIADLLTLLGAALVGRRTARAALGPVEAYRRAAQRAGATQLGRLPVAEDRDDELTRLGHTFNELLARIEDGAARERQFLADASHELRTPLTLMSTELQWAAHRPRSADELAVVLGSLGDQVTRMTDLTDALLESEELAATPEVDREPVSLRALCEEAALDAGEVSVSAPDVLVWVDRRWMRIALHNLLRNAARHGRPPVRLTADVHGEQVMIAVEDAGPGFDADFRAVAFDRFSRAERSRTTPGSGIGLHLVREVARAHGGDAQITGTSEGARVELVLTRHPAT